MQENHKESPGLAAYQTFEAGLRMNTNILVHTQTHIPKYHIKELLCGQVSVGTALPPFNSCYFKKHPA